MIPVHGYYFHGRYFPWTEAEDVDDSYDEGVYNLGGAEYVKCGITAPEAFPVDFFRCPGLSSFIGLLWDVSRQWPSFRERKC
jgi:hypothetical protein